jgi:hypothetical protein
MRMELLTGLLRTEHGTVQTIIHVHGSYRMLNQWLFEEQPICYTMDGGGRRPPSIV